MLGPFESNTEPNQSRQPPYDLTRRQLQDLSSPKRLVLAGVFGNTPDPDFGGVAPDDHHLVGSIGVVLAALGLVTTPAHLASRREHGVTRRFRAAGLSGPTLIASHALVGAVLAAVSSIIVVGLGAAAYGITTPERPATAVGWFIVGLC